ncbi:unnamed protein product, partial [Closterium sp. NIES-54]
PHGVQLQMAHAQSMQPPQGLQAPPFHTRVAPIPGHQLDTIQSMGASQTPQLMETPQHMETPQQMGESQQTGGPVMGMDSRGMVEAGVREAGGRGGAGVAAGEAAGEVAGVGAVAGRGAAGGAAGYYENSQDAHAGVSAGDAGGREAAVVDVQRTGGGEMVWEEGRGGSEGAVEMGERKEGNEGVMEQVGGSEGLMGEGMEGGREGGEEGRVVGGEEGGEEGGEGGVMARVVGMEGTEVEGRSAAVDHEEEDEQFQADLQRAMQQSIEDLERSSHSHYYHSASRQPPKHQSEAALNPASSERISDSLAAAPATSADWDASMALTLREESGESREGGGVEGGMEVDVRGSGGGGGVVEMVWSGAGGEEGLVGLRNEIGEYNCFLNVIIQVRRDCSVACGRSDCFLGVFVTSQIWTPP